MPKLPLPNALIIADGDKPCHDKVLQLAQKKTIVVLDGAYQYAVDMGLKIDYLLGDFDTITADQLREAEQSGIDVINTPDQNFTDLDKAIIFLDKMGIASIDIVAATGNRLDHTLHNIQLLTRFYKTSRPITIMTDTEKVFVLKDDTITLKGKPNQGIAILGAPAATVSSSGLKYDMTNFKMAYGEQNSTCNAFEASEVWLEVEGIALVICQ